jgi:3',5'-cyclic AMP phosphodiesterase CpdA
MRFAQFSDLHLRPAGRLAYGMVDSNAAVARAFDKAAGLDARIEAIVCTGDVTDNGLPGECETLAACLARVAVPVFLLAGNHDRRESLLALPGVRQAGGFIQYVVDDFAVRLVMLDSVVAGATHGELCPARLAWLRAALAAAPERETVIALHHPPILTGIAQYDATALRQVEEFREIVAANPQVTRILCGHIHRLMFGTVAQAVCVVAPSVAYQFSLSHDPGSREGFVLEPPAFLLHDFAAPRGLLTHQIYVDEFAGPFPVPFEPDYPGRCTKGH